MIGGGKGVDKGLVHNLQRMQVGRPELSRLSLPEAACWAQEQGRREHCVPHMRDCCAVCRDCAR